MITVTISINGSPIYCRSACNKETKNKNDATKYLMDTGEVIWHIRENGAVELAVQMLRTIKELK